MMSFLASVESDNNWAIFWFLVIGIAWAMLIEKMFGGDE